MMSDRAADGQVRPIPAGLCERCVHLQIVTSAKGSRFYLCRLSLADPRFPRYPPIPVLRCDGFTPAAPQSDQGETPV
jgi:hypothetical protein